MEDMIKILEKQVKSKNEEVEQEQVFEELSEDEDEGAFNVEEFDDDEGEDVKHTPPKSKHSPKQETKSKKSEAKSPPEKQILKDKYIEAKAAYDVANKLWLEAVKSKDSSKDDLKEAKNELKETLDDLKLSLKKYGIDPNTLSFGNVSCKLNRSNKKRFFGRKGHKRSLRKFGLKNKNRFGSGVYGLQEAPKYTGVYPLMSSNSGLVPDTYLGLDGEPEPVVDPMFVSVDLPVTNVYRDYVLNA